MLCYPGTYKIPSFNDVPADFRVSLLDKSNSRAVHSSKVHYATTYITTLRQLLFHINHHLVHFSLYIHLCTLSLSLKRTLLLQGIGEPPFFLASSAFFAIRNAIKASRSENNVTTSREKDYFLLNLPCTSERIRMACLDVMSCQATDTVGKKGDFQAKGSW